MHLIVQETVGTCKNILRAVIRRAAFCQHCHVILPPGHVSKSKTLPSSNNFTYMYDVYS